MIHLAHELDLPTDAVTQTFGLIGRKGSGKTYAAGVLVEGLADAGAQVVVLDPVGNWYGLRLAADGQGEGLPIPILGGEHGDIPLEPGAGQLVANVLVERRSSAVLDLSPFRKNERKQSGASSNASGSSKRATRERSSFKRGESSPTLCRAR